MKVWIGSVIVILLIAAGVWVMLSPSFTKIGETAEKLKGKAEEEEDGERNTHEKK
ncbi:hypothetical protein [Bacillus testis]|uniref:hypothetical protein n=1 Tax=Bacillus testis TaxID=1622072 RepID=UPI00164EC1A1|nr:hypothetical protein [Bacillus testis]